MGKANKVKREFLDVRDLVELIGVLKDIADMKFHDLFAKRGGFQRFGESFAEFFRLLDTVNVSHPLISNTGKDVCIVVVTTEEGFVGDLNNKVVTRVLEVRSEYPSAKFVTVGRKGVMKLEMMGIKSEKIYEELGDISLYDLAVQLKDHLVDQVMKGAYGRVIVVYPWPKDLQTIRARTIKLLPADFIFKKQAQTVESFSKVIEESDPLDIIGYLVGLWTSSKIYEVMLDTSIAAVAAQSQQLDTSLMNVKKEELNVKLKWRKARKGDIDKSLRETFSSRLMTKR